jgi:hypothetical protein
MNKPKTIFIASASEDTTITMMIAEAIRDAQISTSLCFVLEPKPWFKEEFTLNHANLHSLVKFPKKYDYACFLFTPRDTIISKDMTSLRVRDNVVFEFGLFVSQKDGINKSFIIHPDDNNLKLASDIAGIVTVKYTHTSNPQFLSANIKAAVARIIKAIEEFEDELKDRSAKAVNASVANLRATLEKTKPEDQPRVILDALKDLAETKAEALNQTATEVLKDIVIWTNTVLDISDPDDLAKMQKGELETVWVYSCMPIEFDSNVKIKKLKSIFKEMVISNLEKGTKYFYFVDSENTAELIKELSHIHSDKVEVFLLEPHCVTSNYVFHFYKDKTVSVFQNIVRNGILESLIKLENLDADVLIKKISSQFEKFAKVKEGNLWINRRVRIDKQNNRN